MNADKFEIWVHDNILKNAKIRHGLHNIYQRILIAASPKFSYEGDVERITPDDGYEYLFGYYDKCPWSDDNRYLLALKVKNAYSHADNMSKAEIVIFDLLNQNRCAVVAETCTWNVQQGCMAQWIDNETILYNDCRDNHYVAVVHNISDGTERVLDFPVYTVSNDKKIALSLDFSRLHRLRPGYGYSNLPEETKNENCPDSTCIWKIDLISGEIQPLLKYTDFADFETKETMIDAEHKVNHLMISPDGKRFMVLHRWFKNKTKYTRLVTCNIDGTGMYNLSDDDFVSHCCWKNNEEIISYLNKKDDGKGYYLLKDQTQEYRRLWQQLAMDGHPTVSHDGRYVVTDTYPNRKRIQSLYVMFKDNVQCLAKVFSPFKYSGDTRCDLHPRWNKDGTLICFDSSFSGKRAIYTVKANTIQEKSFEVTSNGNNAPLVSVVIPTHNRADLIGGAVASALNQTYKNIEIIVVSDGSTDKTDDVMNEITRNNSSVKYISYSPNQGGNHARNVGIQNSTGKYIAFLDDDDNWYENKLEKQVRIAENDQSLGLITCGSVTVNDDTHQITRKIPHIEYNSSKAILFNNSVGTTSTVMVRRTVLEKSGVFDEKLPARQDYDLWIRICQCSNISIVNECLVEYHVAKGNNQISGNTYKYEQATEILIGKYSSLLNQLSESEKKAVISGLYYVVARKAVKNNQRKLARKNIYKAQKINFTLVSVLYWFGSFFPADFSDRIRKKIKKIFSSKGI